MYIAIDGGGTKTEYLLLNSAFEAVARRMGGPTNHERLPNGFEGVRAELEQSMDALLTTAGSTRAQVDDIVAGMSGADDARQVAQLEGIFADMGFRRAMVCNDGYLPIKGACRGGVGIAYNCGTGVCCAAVGEHGERIQIGGRDEWTDDAGGGVWIAQRVFAAVYDEMVLQTRRTDLTRRCAPLFAQAPADPAQMLGELQRSAAAQRGLIEAFFGAWESGDEVAAAIGERMIERGVAYIRAACKREWFPSSPVQIVLTGSVLLRAASPKYLCAFCSRVEDALSRCVCWKKAAREPVWGAAGWLKERNGP